MNLGKLPFLEKKESSEYYLSLILGNEKVKAVIFEKIGTTIKYINQAEVNFTNTIEDASIEEFLDVLDKAITSAETKLPNNIETHKTLYSLKDSWVENAKIKKEYLEKLKKAGTELSLKPIGFLISSESIINLIQKEEGAPITAILVEIGKKYLTIYLVKTGKILEIKSSEIHESNAFTTDTLLKHLQTPEVMPSRIIICDSGDEELTQEFIGHKWSKSLPFLHLPQIVNLPIDSDVKAALLGAVSQMGTGLILNINNSDSSENFERPKELIIEKTDEEKPAIDPLSTNDNKDSSKLDYVGEDSSMDFFGFVSGDIAKVKTPILPTKTDDLLPENLDEKSEEIPNEIKYEEEKTESIGTLGVLTAEKAKNFLTILPNLIGKINLKSIPISKLKRVKGIKLILIPVILILIFLFLFFFILQTKANIIITVNPKPDEKTQSITFSKNTPTDLSGNIISAEIIPVEENGSTTVNATGGKDIGTKATGTVTIFNNDSDSISLSSGTTITSSNGQKFTLDTSINVASSSGDVFSGTKPGTKDVKITAAEIGTESNLPSGTKFTIGTNKNIAGKNDNAFSGGTKKSVTVVSKEDIAKLLTNLPKELSDKAKADIAGKISSGKTILPTFIDTEISDDKLSKKQDEEAKEVTLTANVSFNYIAYKNSDLKDLGSKLFDSSNFSVKENSLEVNAKNIKVEKNNDITADLNIKAKLLPKINISDLTKQIAGENTLKTKNMLGNLDQVANVTITIMPNLPFISNNLPKDFKNIKITISSN